MRRCFVIQPYEGPFDKRYDGLIAPAIQAAGFEPYRVDRDPSATELIAAIESGIAGAAVCLADITTSNPNVFYEIGYARALGKPLVLIWLRHEGDLPREPPFDVKHLKIVEYRNDAPDDFVRLKNDLIAHLQAAVEAVVPHAGDHGGAPGRPPSVETSAGAGAPLHPSGEEAAPATSALSPDAMTVLSWMQTRGGGVGVSVPAALLHSELEERAVPPADLQLAIASLVEARFISIDGPESTEQDMTYQLTRKGLGSSGRNPAAGR